ncbi:MAG: hypothetical protein CSB55_05260 [Candidatus Cloacimonadota bacterium]|nr:MAG: hypothetical protein CSB55_05260 [Candidatus Cloacimonadota bacterium]
MSKYVKKTFQYFSGKLLEKISVFFTIPILTGNLSGTDYGIYVNTGFYVSICSLILLLGFEQAIFSFFNAGKTKDYHKKLFASMFGLMGIAGVISAFALFIFSDQLSYLLAKENNISGIFLLVSGIIYFDSFTALTGSVFNMGEDAKRYAVITNLKTVLILVGFLVFSHFHDLTLILVYRIIFIFSFIQFPVSVFFLHQKFNFNFFTDIFKNIDFVLVRKLLIFSLPMIPGTLGSLILRSSDRLMLTHLSENGLVASGLYGVGYRMGMIMGFLFSIISLSFFPVAIKKYQKENDDNYGLLREMFNIICKYGFLLGLGIIMFVPDLFSFYVGPDFFVARKYVIYGVGSVFMLGIMNYYNLGFYIHKKSYHIAGIVISASLLNIFLNWLLIPEIGIVGAGISSVAAYAVASFFHGRNSYRLFGIAPDFAKSFYVLTGFIIADFLISDLKVCLSNFFMKLMIFSGVSLMILLRSYKKKDLIFRNIFK